MNVFQIVLQGSPSGYSGYLGIGWEQGLVSLALLLGMREQFNQSNSTVSFIKDFAKGMFHLKIKSKSSSSPA